MSLVFDLYLPGRSWLYRLDPRVKLAGLCTGILGAFLLHSLVAQGALLLGVHLLLRVGGIPWRSIGWLWRQMRMLVILILLLQPFFAPGGAILFRIGPAALTLGGLANALFLALRAVNMTLLAGALLFTTEQRALVQALVCLGIPYTWGLTLSLTLRFLPAINTLFINVREAQAARGWVATGNLFQRAREYLPVLVAVIIGTLRQSDQLTLALAARGLGTPGRRTTWRELAMRPGDWAALAALALALTALVGWRWLR